MDDHHAYFVVFFDTTDIGLLEGADRTFGGFLLHNLVPVTLGNFAGGGLFLGVAQWATYDTGSSSVNARRPNDYEDDEGMETGAAARQNLLAVGSINSEGKDRV